MAVVTITGSDVSGGSPSGGAVGGASNLTTAGAVPYVASAGVLTQDATALFWDAANDRLGLGTAAPSASLTIEGPTQSWDGAAMRLVGTGTGARTYGFYVGNSGQWFFDDVTGSAARMTIFSSGNIVVGPAPTDGNYRLDIAASGSSGTLRVYDQTVTTGSTSLVVRAGAGQSGNLTTWQNSSGTEIASIGSVGNFIGTSDVAAGSAWSIYWTGRAVLKSPADSVITLLNQAQTDFNRLQFGGTTSSFPALKRSSAILQVRLADDSANTQIQASRFISDQTTPSASTDAGTAGAIWADATYLYVQTAAGTIKRVTLNAF